MTVLPRTGTILVNMTSLDHGLAVTDSSRVCEQFQRGVYRWPYTTGQRELLSGMEIAVKDIPAPSDQLHPTRTRLIDEDAMLLYLATGSEQTIDLDSARANILRYAFYVQPIVSQ